jgi:hypothetical protein
MESTNKILKGIRDGSGGGALVIPMNVISEEVTIDGELVTKNTVTLDATFDDVLEIVENHRNFVLSFNGVSTYFPLFVSHFGQDPGFEIVMSDMASSDSIRQYAFYQNADHKPECWFISGGGK